MKKISSRSARKYHAVEGSGKEDNNGFVAKTTYRNVTPYWQQGITRTVCGKVVGCGMFWDPIKTYVTVGCDLFPYLPPKCKMCEKHPKVIMAALASLSTYGADDDRSGPTLALKRLAGGGHYEI